MTSVGAGALLKEASPNKSLCRHSTFTDRSQRSANAFNFGLHGGSRRHFTISHTLLPGSPGIQHRTLHRDHAKLWLRAFRYPNFLQRRIARAIWQENVAARRAAAKN